MAVVYQPMVLYDNAAERLTLTTNRVGTTGYGIERVVDGKHWTYYTPATDGSVTMTITGDFKLDTVVIQSATTHTDVNVTIQRNGGTAYATQVGLRSFNIFRVSSAVYAESLTVTITQPAGQRIKITHLWAGLSQRISNPVYEFDDDAAAIDVTALDDNCIQIRNLVNQKKRVLRANFDAISTEFDDFLDYSYRYGKPFIFAFRPDDVVYDGGLYHFDTSERNNPLTMRGQRRNVTLTAECPYVWTWKVVTSGTNTGGTVGAGTIDVVITSGEPEVGQLVTFDGHETVYTITEVVNNG